MTSPETAGPIQLRRRLPVFLSLLLILVAAFALRAWNLTGIPPGLTHDEANHGREAIDVLDGIFLYFFPLNYGSEPLYSYTVALFMALLGRGLLALRLVNVVFGTAVIAVTYGWAAPRLGRATALLTAALMAVSFWPLASSREALRAGMLPFFMVLAVWFFWRILELRTSDQPLTAGQTGGSDVSLIEGRHPSPAILVIGFGLAIALTLHIYLAARVSWLLFPIFLTYLGLFHRDMFRRSWRRILAGLLLAGVLVAPMFIYLRAHPEMQTRLDMLDKPLQAITAGQIGPILANMRDALLAFVWPGFGDQFLAYNIPGRPVFEPISAAFFVAGLVVCLWRWRRPVYTFLLMWFLVGIIPSLITGPTANTTRNMAALPAVFLIAAVGFVIPITQLLRRAGTSGNKPVTANTGSSPADRRRLLPAGLALVWIVLAGLVSAQDYFFQWAQSPEVRGAYQQTLVRSIEYVAASYPEAEPLVFSSVYPGPAHDSSIALVLAADRPAISRTARWVDGRYGLALPSGTDTLVVVPSSTPLHPVFSRWLQPVERVEMRSDDLDSSFTIYQVDGESARDDLATLPALTPPANFDGAIELVAAGWLTESIRPGDTAELMTVWRVLEPAKAGPRVPPTFTTDAVMFTHVVDPEGHILAQRDSLDVPSWAWQRADTIVQIHPVALPAGTPPGEYRAVTGIYDRTSGARLQVGDRDSVEVSPLVIVP